MAQSVYDYFTGLLGIDEDEQRRRSLERAVGRAPVQLNRDVGGLLGSAAMSRSPARAADYPEIAEAVRGTGFRQRELDAALDRRAEIGQKAAGYSADIPSVMQLTPNEIRAIGLQGAAQNLLSPLESAEALSQESEDDTVIGRAGKTALGALANLGGNFPHMAGELFRYAMSPADDPYEFEKDRVTREAQKSEVTRADALKASDKAAAIAQKIIDGREAELTEDEKAIAGPVAQKAAAEISVAGGAPAQATAQQQRGLLQSGATPSVGGLLAGFGQDLTDVLAAYGTLQASQPALVTADDLDKLRPITGPQIIAQTQKIKRQREAAELAASKEATQQMKDRLAAIQGLSKLSAEEDKKLQRQAESMMDARQNVEFIDKALGLIDEAYDYGPLGSSGVAAQSGAAISSNIAGTAAYNLESVLTTLRARIGFDKLQEMRQNSPTGGALGQVSDFENRLLQATEGNLQLGVDPALMKQSLRDIRFIQLGIANGIVDKTGQLRRIQSMQDVEDLRNNKIRAATANDVGLIGSGGKMMQYNRQTGTIE